MCPGQASEQLVLKYGKTFGEQARANATNSVNERVGTRRELILLACFLFACPVLRARCTAHEGHRGRVHPSIIFRFSFSIVLNGLGMAAQCLL